MGCGVVDRIEWRARPEPAPPASTPEPSRLSTDEKVALFRRLFRGRTDVYPIRWESKTTAKSGYSPACANEWRAGVCEKPRIKCGDCSNRLLIPLVGEGFDHPPLDTLILAMPVSWKGTLQQYAGRLHREHVSKTDVRIIDFVDKGHPALLRMWDKRQRGSAEPLLPPGLSRLTAAQQSLVEFLEIGRDLLMAAGLPDQQAPDLDTKSNAELDAWIAELPTAEKAAMLKLLLTGHAQQAERRLKSRFLAWQRERQPVGEPESRRRTVAELQELAASIAEARKKQEAVQHKNAEAERRAKHETYLRTLAADFDQCWQVADKRAERGIASAYDEAKGALVELAEAYTLCASRADFDRRLAQFMVRHGKRLALVRRLAEAGLWKKS